MSYQVEVTKEAEKQIRRLDRLTQQRLRDRIEELAHAPFDPRVSKELRMHPGKRSSRLGKWRIIYLVDEVSQKVMILAVRPRPTAYK